MKQMISRRAVSLCLVAGLLCVSVAIHVSAASGTPRVKKQCKLVVGQKQSLKVTGKRIKSVSFRSTKPKIASVTKKGKVKARRAGKCQIQIKVKYKKKAASRKYVVKKLYCNVVVKQTGNTGKKVTAAPGGQKPEDGKIQATAVPADSEATTKPMPTKKPVSTFVPDEFSAQIADASIRLLQQSSQTRIASGENVLISPESIITAVTMAMNGAAGDTLEEMQAALAGSLSLDEFNQTLSEYNDRLANAKETKFHIANSIWMRDDAERLTVEEDFLEKNRQYYHSESYLEPFDQSTVQKINDWVNTNTDGMIPQIVDSLSGDEVMHLINALCFEGQWQTQYETPQEGELFTNAAGQKENARMLEAKESQYICDDQVTGFVKPYKGGEYAFMALLPDEDISLADYVKSLTGDTVLNLYHERQYQEVLTRVPEFSYDDCLDLIPALSAMGISKAFTTDADFSKMATTSTGALYISRVLHKTHIELDQYGTKAAAVTDIAMNDCALVIGADNPKVYLDRPFVYAIVETDSGLPVFIGAVNTVQ